jgi:signal peptide peptidase SppA
MSQRIGMMEAMSGGVSTQTFSAALREAVNNPQVKAIIIDVASPGGSVYGVDELATEIHSLREQKPIVAVANSLMASAAYYSMSNASEVVITPGGELGSIGVIAMHVDQSELNAKEGIKPTFISAGKYKAEGNPHEPLSAEAHAEIQAQVDRYYGMFLSAVARGREVSVETVRAKYGQGRVVGAKEAVRLGMADRVATLDETIRRFAGGGRATRRGASAEVLDEPLGFEPEDREVVASDESQLQRDRDRLLVR